MMPGYGEQMRAISLKYAFAVIHMQRPGFFSKLRFCKCALLACCSHQDVRAYHAALSSVGMCQQLSCQGKQLG